MMSLVVFSWKSPFVRSRIPRALVVTNLAPQCCASIFATTEIETTDHMPPIVGDGPPTIISTGLMRIIQDRKRLIGCTIYITAGGRQGHAPLLTDLVQRAQNLFQEKSSKTYGDNVPPNSLMDIPSEDETDRSMGGDSKEERYDLGILVHAFTDKVYNRTSLHLAGTPEIILDVASELIEHVVVELRKLVVDTEISSMDSSTDHPHVGLVDHVAVVPLITGMESRIVDPDTKFSPQFLTTHGANVARKLGIFIRDKLNIHVFFYGLAHRNKISLVKVRRRQTTFFKGKARIIDGPLEPELPTSESCTVGAPEEFVENYNVRIKESCSKKAAQHLCRSVRESDGGLDGVEAITLQYSKNRWEIACNLLRPHAGGADVDALKEEFRDWNKDKKLMEKGYRVGTTQAQSIKVLETISRSAKRRKAHDKKIRMEFQSYLDIEE